MNTVQGQNIALKDSLRVNEKVCERPLRAYLIFRALIRDHLYITSALVEGEGGSENANFCLFLVQKPKPSLN